MELKMRYWFSYKDGEYKGKGKCNLPGVFEKISQDTEYEHKEVDKETYESK